MRLPNGNRADLGTKLEDYTLNMLHREGRHTARVFESLLGITADNADVLRGALLDAAAAADQVEARGDSEFGTIYILRFSRARPGAPRPCSVCGSSAAGKTFPGSRPVISCENGGGDQHARCGGPSRGSARQAFRNRPTALAGPRAGRHRRHDP